jgi:hypothetical protein
MPYGYTPAEFDYIDNEEDENPAASGCLMLFASFFLPLYILLKLATKPWAGSRDHLLQQLVEQVQKRVRAELRP